MTGSLTYVGSWRSSDVIALFGVFFDGQPFRGSGRDYWIRYPGFTKINLGVTQDLMPQLMVFARVENIGNVHALERDNLTTPMGGSASSAPSCTTSHGISDGAAGL